MAGEAGRGFAVVADEVRVLATRTSESTHEIETMLLNLSTKSSEAVESMQRAKGQAQHSGDSVQVAAEALGIGQAEIHIEEIHPESAFPTFKATLVLPDKTEIALFAKNLGKRTRLVDDTTERRERELKVTSELLDHLTLGTARFVAQRWEAEGKPMADYGVRRWHPLEVA